MNINQAQSGPCGKAMNVVDLNLLNVFSKMFLGKLDGGGADEEIRASVKVKIAGTIPCKQPRFRVCTPRVARALLHSVRTGSRQKLACN
jgi:hypothetical protein